MQKKEMESSTSSSVELLKQALSNLRQPELLNNHPWAVLIAGSGSKSAGVQLVELLTKVFRNTRPSGPPRTGKRLDTRWGVFGVLAAQYFAPAILGTPSPTSLREAWESLDRSILLFTFGRFDGLSEDERALYRFAANEIAPAPNSTLSDWHRRGIEQLAELVTGELARISNNKKTSTRTPEFGRKVTIGLVLAGIVLVVFLGWQSWQFYRRAQAVAARVEELQAYLSPTPQIEKLPEVALKVHELRAEIDLLSMDAAPYMWIPP